MYQHHNWQGALLPEELDQIDQCLAAAGNHHGHMEVLIFGQKARAVVDHAFHRDERGIERGQLQLGFRGAGSNEKPGRGRVFLSVNGKLGETLI